MGEKQQQLRQSPLLHQLHAECFQTDTQFLPEFISYSFLFNQPNITAQYPAPIESYSFA